MKLGEVTAKMEKAKNGGANQYQAKRTAVSNEQKRNKTKLGELTSKMEKSVGGRPSETHPNSGESFLKKQQLANLGITHAERFETLAKHPEVVEKAKADARAGSE